MLYHFGNELYRGASFILPLPFHVLPFALLGGLGNLHAAE